MTFVVGLTGLAYGVSRGGLSGWSGAQTVVGLAMAAVLLPAFVLIERRARAPMLDLTIFSNRLFAAATGAAFINGLSRFALMFVFVFYFQGAQGDDAITAGIKLAPMAVGMLLSSPPAGLYADRYGSRALSALGMLVTAGGLAAMTTLQPHTPYWQSTLWLLIVGLGSGMFNSPNTAAMMGTVPSYRRGIAAGARTMLQNTGAVLSIAFVMAVITSAVPKPILFRIFSGLSQGLSVHQLAPFISNMHLALWCWTGVSLIGAAVPAAVPGVIAARRPPAEPRSGASPMSAAARRPCALRIGDARLVGTTPRTIRYYEEIGLLGDADSRSGRHRSTPRPRSSACARSSGCVTCSGSRWSSCAPCWRPRAPGDICVEEYHQTEAPAERRRILRQASRHIDTQLELVEGRLTELTELRDALKARRAGVEQSLSELPSE